MRFVHVGVLGAGTMGAAIAAIAADAGLRVSVYDPDPAALDRLGAGDARLVATPVVSGLAGADLVVEAAPERLELKAALLREVQATCGPSTVLATNTSSLRVSEIAAALAAPGRLVGMHFFNPVTRMALVEVVATVHSDADAIETVERLAVLLGKTPVRARDSVGFIVNRCLRPFYSEALRIVADGTGTADCVDRAMRGVGFRMGPFALMDLVGLDVSLDIQRSFYEQSFGEPRWRPSPWQAELVAAGQLGRKTGAGFHRYGAGPASPPAGVAAASDRIAVWVGGERSDSVWLRDAALAAGHRLVPAPDADLQVSGDAAETPAPSGRPLLVSCAAASLAAQREARGAVGFALGDAAASTVELVRGPHSRAAAADLGAAFFASLGSEVLWVGDGPGLIATRIISQLVNEAFFAGQEGVGSAAQIDSAMRLGANWPHGPFGWGARLGLASVVATLDALQAELGDDRYRAAASLRRSALDQS